MTVGSAHTQWCDHDTGETTRPNSATHISASVGSPAARTRRTAQMVRPSTAKQASVHSTKWVLWPRPSRARAPAMFWLVFSAALPMRSVWRTVVVQYSTESRQASANPSRLAATKLPTAVSAARPSRRSRKYSRNTAGVSFSAIARPSSRPARPRGAARHAVGDHQRHQHDVDLAEGEVGGDRLQVDHGRRHDARRQPAAAQPGRFAGQRRGLATRPGGSARSRWTAAPAPA